MIRDSFVLRRSFTEVKRYLKLNGTIFFHSRNLQISINEVGNELNSKLFRLTYKLKIRFK